MQAFVSEDGQVYCHFPSHHLERIDIDISNGMDGFIKVYNLPEIKKISIAKDGDAIFCLDFYGNVFFFGINYYYLVDVTYDSYNEDNDNSYAHMIYPPVKIETPNNIFMKDVYFGNRFAFFVSELNQLYLFGTMVNVEYSDEENQPLISNNSELFKKIKLFDKKKENDEEVDQEVEIMDCSKNYALIKTSSGKFYKFGGLIKEIFSPFINDEITLCEDYPENIKSVKCSNDHVLLLTDDGYVYSYGKNYFNSPEYDFNIPRKIESLPEIIQIECGKNGSYFVDVERNLWISFHEKSQQKPKKVISDVAIIKSMNKIFYIKNMRDRIFALSEDSYTSTKFGEKVINGKKLTRIFIDEEHIWNTNDRKSRQKSARK